jgi:hypothetical protein
MACFAIITHKSGKPLQAVEEQKFYVSAQKLHEFELGTEVQFYQILSLLHFVNTWTGQKYQTTYRVMRQNSWQYHTYKRRRLPIKSEPSRFSETEKVYKRALRLGKRETTLLQ